MSESKVSIHIGAGKLYTIGKDGIETELGTISNFKVTRAGLPPEEVKIVVAEIDLEEQDVQET